MIFLLKYFKKGTSSSNHMTCLISSSLMRMSWSRDDHMVLVWLGRGPKIEPEVDRSLQKLSDRDRNIFTHNYLYITISSFKLILHRF